LTASSMEGASWVRPRGSHGRVAAMAAAYELAGGGPTKGRWLGKAEGAVELLGSCLPWCGAAYRRRSTRG